MVRLILPCYALAEDDVEGEGDRAAEGDEVADECGRVPGDTAGAGGEDGYADERDGHAEGLA
jgi:hypothetical protein